MVDDEVLRRYDQAERKSWFLNCTGFVAFLLDLTHRETFVDPDDAKNGILRHLDSFGIQDISPFNESEYLTRAALSDAIAVLGETRPGKWTFLHFFVPHPKVPGMVLQRNGFEKAEPETMHITRVLDDEEYRQYGKFLMFFKKKNS